MVPSLTVPDGGEATPFGHDSACLTEKAAPQAQLVGVLAGKQPYLRANASWKSKSIYIFLHVVCPVRNLFTHSERFSKTSDTHRSPQA